MIFNLNSLCCSFPQERRRPSTTARSWRRSSSTTPRSNASLNTGTCPRASTTRRMNSGSWEMLDAGSTSPCSFCFLTLHEVEMFSPLFVTTTSYHDAPLHAKVLPGWVWATQSLPAHGKSRRWDCLVWRGHRQVLRAHLKAWQWIDCPSLRCCPMIHSPASPHSIYRRCCDSTSCALPPLIIKPFMFSATPFVCLSSVTFIFSVLLFVCLSLLNVAAPHTSDSAADLPSCFTERRTSASTASRAPSPWCLKRRSTSWLWSNRVAEGDETEPEITRGTCSRCKTKSWGWTCDWLIMVGFERQRLYTTG